MRTAHAAAAQASACRLPKVRQTLRASLLLPIARARGRPSRSRCSRAFPVRIYPALNRLKTRDDDDFSIAFLDATAVMLDILTFYQERLANERYLRTATQLYSLTQLSQLIGYQPSPGVSASTYLAFTLTAAPGLPATPGTTGDHNSRRHYGTERARAGADSAVFSNFREYSGQAGLECASSSDRDSVAAEARAKERLPARDGYAVTAGGCVSGSWATSDWRIS